MGHLHPFFCYYGGKWRAAKRYPTPLHDTIVEPFAGGAGYSVRYHDHKVVLYEADPVVYELWDYLVRVTPAEIMALPSRVDHVDDVKAPDPAKSLIGFWLNKGVTSPKKTPSAWARSGVRPNSFWGQTIKERIASQVPRIRHWKVKNASYETAENIEATWYVDPPYQGACGNCYRYRDVDYDHLGNWCQNRLGQVIVCEQEGATWLPFEPFAAIKATPGSRGKSYSKEVIWTNESSLLPCDIGFYSGTATLGS